MVAHILSDTWQGGDGLGGCPTDQELNARRAPSFPTGQAAGRFVLTRRQSIHDQVHMAYSCAASTHTSSSGSEWQLDPITALGTAGAVLGVIDVLSKTIGAVSQIREQWKLVYTVIRFELQLTALNTALSQVQGVVGRQFRIPSLLDGHGP